jgi:hypothetical protein
MRTTVDLPDPLFRRTKAIAALRGVSMKEVITHALEREVAEAGSKTKPHRVKLPIIRSWKGPKLDLSNFDFDELLD